MLIKVAKTAKNSTATTPGGEKSTIFTISIISDVMCIHVQIFMKIREKSYFGPNGQTNKQMTYHHPIQSHDDAWSNLH